MSNFGQAALSIGGAFIGGLLTGGNPAGIAWGYLLDCIPGAQAFPATNAIGRDLPLDAKCDVALAKTIPLV